MYGISKFSVTQPVLINLLTAIVLFTGVATVFLLPRELFPMVSLDFVVIVTIYPRASADEMEKTITIPIEEEVADVRGIKSLQSTTVEGRSVVLIEVDPEVSDTTKVQRDAENEIDKVVSDLPLEAEKPVVTEFVFDFPVVTVSVAGAPTEMELKRTAEKVQDRLRQVRGVSSVSIGGKRDEEIWAEVDPLRLYGYGLTLEDIRRAIQMGGLDLAAGVARSSGEEFIVRTKELYTGPQDLKRVVLKTDGKGGRVRIGDIAEIRDTFEEHTNIGRLDAERCINLDVKQRPGGDSIQVMEDVRAAIAELEPLFPYGVTAKLNRDVSFMVRERLDLLISNGLQGLFLCLLLLRMFLNSRLALFTGMGIPFAMLSALMLMRFWGISLNMISMFGLIIVLGMLVDDGIVVSENIHRYRQMGVDPVTSSIKGTGEVFWSVVGSVTTTIASFMPIFFMTGIMGKFCRPIPLVVSFALASSILEAMVVLPAHLAEWGEPRNWFKLTRWNRPIRAALETGGLLRPLTDPGFVHPLVRTRQVFLTTLYVIFFPVLQAGVLLMRGAQWCGQTFDNSVLSPNYWFSAFLRFYTRFLIRCLRYRIVGIILGLGLTGGAAVFYGFSFSGLQAGGTIHPPLSSLLLMFLGVTVLLVGFVLTVRFRVASIVLPILLVTGLLASYAKQNLFFQLFKNNDFSFFLINVELPAGARLESTETAMEAIEHFLLSMPKTQVEAVITRVGLIEQEGGVMNFGSNKGQIIVDLTESAVRPDIDAQAILDHARDNMPAVPEVSSLDFFVDQGGPPLGSPLTFRIMGEEYGPLLEVSEEVQAYLRGLAGVKSIKDDFEWGKEEFRIHVDEQKAADLGIEVAEVAREMRNAFAGGLATSFTRGEEEVEIHVKFPEAYRVSPENIRLMKFRSRNGALVPFDSVAEIIYGQSNSVIHHWNQNRAVTVTADVDNVHMTSKVLNNLMKERYGYKSKDRPGIIFDYGGEEKDSQESMAALGRAFALAMFINYAIIATIFNSLMQPFVVMSVIPLSLGGVLIGLLVHGEPLGFMGLLGVVALVGIVVNNSILIVDFTNQARRRGMDRWRSIVWASRSRVRPIFLTSATTIAGLSPMLTGLQGTSSFLAPLAISLVYGLAFSTTLTLLVIPVILAYLDGFKLACGLRLLRTEYDESLLNQDFHTHPLWEEKEEGVTPRL